MSLPKNKDVAEIKTLLWDIFSDLNQKGYLRKTLESERRKIFIDILKTSNDLFDVFNMLFGISDLQGKFVRERNKEFVERNKDFGLTETRFVNLLLSESMSVFLRNVELFRCCFLFVLKTKKRKKQKKGKKGSSPSSPFFHDMTMGQLTNELVLVCGKRGEKIKRKIDVKLRNGLTHGLVWIEGWDIVYSEDVTLAKTKRKRIKLDKLWKKASKQSMITQCLIETIPDWYEKNKQTKT